MIYFKFKQHFKFLSEMLTIFLILVSIKILNNCVYFIIFIPLFTSRTALTCINIFSISRKPKEWNQSNLTPKIYPDRWIRRTSVEYEINISTVADPGSSSRTETKVELLDPAWLNFDRTGAVDRIREWILWIFLTTCTRIIHNNRARYRYTVIYCPGGVGRLNAVECNA